MWEEIGHEVPRVQAIRVRLQVQVVSAAAIPVHLRDVTAAMCGYGITRVRVGQGCRCLIIISQASLGPEVVRGLARCIILSILRGGGRRVLVAFHLDDGFPKGRFSCAAKVCGQFCLPSESRWTVIVVILMVRAMLVAISGETRMPLMDTVINV
jgi:hypothetical protein